MSESTSSTIVAHGALRLPAVEVDSYNIEIKDDDAFLGDRASKGPFAICWNVGANLCARGTMILSATCRARTSAGRS
jgi:hypothetical protein